MQRLNGLMQKEMTRQQFLATIGIAVITILGFGNVFEFLSKNLGHKQTAATDLPAGSYGGTKKPAVS